MKILAIITLAPAGIAAAQPASFQGVGDLPGEPFESAAYGVSADGLVVVGSSIGASNRAPVRWTAAAGLQSLEPEPLGLWNWHAVAASSDGSAIVGFSEATWTHRAFRWTQATGAVDLGDLPGGAVWAEAHDVSGDGSIIVGSSDAGAGGAAGYYTAFRWTESSGMQAFLPVLSYTGAFGISADGTTIVGAYPPFGYRWTAEGGMQMFEVHTGAYATSSDGTVVIGNDYHYFCGAFRWTLGTGAIQCLATGTGLTNTVATAVSGDGEVVVGRSFTTPPFALIWDASQGMRNLRGVLEDQYGLDLTGWQVSQANDISADGKVIVGEGVNPCGRKEGWVARLGTTACPPDCNADGALTVGDFACFQTRFVANDPYADCTRDCQFTVADFGCFQTKFVAGCP